MNPTDIFMSLQGRLRFIAFRRLRVLDAEGQDELLSVAALAMWVAWLNRHRCRIALEDYLVLCCQNAMLNYVRAERRHRRRVRTWAWDRLDEQAAIGLPELDVSEDAEGVAWALILHGMKDGRRRMYREIGFDRTWECIRELKEALS